jgi:hypothetical protein
MASASGTLETLVLQVGKLLQPLESLLGPDFFFSLGAELPREIAGDATLLSQLSAASAAASALDGDISALSSAIAGGNAGSIVSAGAALITSIGKLISALENAGAALAQAANGLSAADKARLQAFAPTMAVRTLEYMLVGYLTDQTPSLATTLDVLGLIDREFTPSPTLEVSRAPFTVTPRRFYFDRIAQLLKSPADHFQQAFGWGGDAFDGSALLPKVQALFETLGVPAAIYTTAGQPPVLEAFIFNLQADKSTTPPGMKAEVSLPGNDTFDQAIPFSTLWQGTLHAQANYAAGVGVTLRPPFTIGVLPPTGSFDVDVQLGLQAPASGADPIVMLGVAGGSRLQATSIAGSVGVNASLGAGGGALSPEIGFQIKGGQLFIDMSEADGFLSDVTSGTPIQASFDLAATWAPETGLHVTGGAQLEIDLPLHIDLGPVTIETVYVIGGLEGGDLTLALALALGVTLGPIQASVDKVGLAGTLSFPASGGNLGPADLTVGFKPPNGLGLEIDAGPASGGGYISFDPAQGQYAGVLQVSILDVVQVEVIGVIDTIMPDGSSGFSFILIITFDLPPIQLGFGFTLNGVGGLGGVNRTINTTALQAGFVAHSLNSILFPPDPIANAPEIISNIRNFFPVAQNSYVFGPMMEVGWGTPTLITLEVGVILELPNPVVIVLLGLVDVALPDADAPLIQLHIDILGELDFGTKTLELEGDMYDSSVLIYSMAGSLYFSVSWGSDPNFVYSVGGFNPHFNTAGLNIPPMQRCSVSIGVGDNPRISANNYFAVTSNSLQFGANVQAYASAAGFSIQGYLGFDVLIIFSPFSFEFDFTVSFSVSFEGVNLLGLSVSGAFSGPRPWNFNGSASISILFWTVSASVNLTWGDSSPVTIPQKPVLPDLANALQTPGNWSAALPAGMTPAVTLTTPTGGSAQILVYPMGTLSVRENVTPLDVPITRYGNAAPSDGNEFAISDVQINNQETQRQPLQEYFAPGQFNALSDADKLSAPSFELYDAGVTIGSSAIDAGEDSARTVVYEEFYIDSPMSYSRSTGPYLMGAALSAALGRQGAGFLSPVTNTGMSKYSAGPAPGAIATADAGFVIANTNDLSVRSDLSPAAGVTYFQARSALATHLASTPADSGSLQIMSLYEVAA